ncbi:MAG: hypothetical protein ACYTXY_37275, partial [Nostoc sp.]
MTTHVTKLYIQPEFAIASGLILEKISVCVGWVFNLIPNYELLIEPSKRIDNLLGRLFSQIIITHICLIN